MENFGIYEVAPEDFALCEYVCTTKINIQDKIRQGLDLLLANVCNLNTETVIYFREIFDIKWSHLRNLKIGNIY